MKPIFTLVFAIVMWVSASAQSEITIWYIGNMGVLISDANSSVLIDGLHDEYRKDSYTFPTIEIVNSIIENSGSEYPPINAILTTHYHQDHFDELLINRFLTSNELSVFIASEQATSQITAGKDQLIPISTESYQKQSVKVGEHTITAFYLNHVNPGRFDSIQNVGFIIDINGYKILHVGDTNWFDKAFDAAELASQRIDVAILPFWMLMSEESVKNYTRWINAHHVIATHLFYKDYEEYEREILSFFPEAKLFTQPGDSLRFKN